MLFERKCRRVATAFRPNQPCFLEYDTSREKGKTETCLKRDAKRIFNDDERKMYLGSGLHIRAAAWVSRHSEYMCSAESAKREGVAVRAETVESAPLRPLLLPFPLHLISLSLWPPRLLLYCIMAVLARSQPRLKSLSLSSTTTNPFEGAASPPSPSLNGRNKALHKSSSIADLRQSFTTTMSKPKFLKRFTSKDKDLFGCAGEEGASGAFTSARGSSDLDLDQLDEEEDAEMHEVSFTLQ